VLSRQTRQRELILDVVRSTMDHPTADWVYRQARRRLARISLGTVYRNLSRRRRAGP
jgi:Fe2+ or Zn2+ uptake regulation protein